MREREKARESIIVSNSTAAWVDFSTFNNYIDYRPKLVDGGILDAIVSNMDSKDLDAQWYSLSLLAGLTQKVLVVRVSLIRGS